MKNHFVLDAMIIAIPVRLDEPVVIGGMNLAARHMSVKVV